MAYTVKRLADLAGVSTRTLRYYDAIGLLKPAEHGQNGYRYYDEVAALRLQQILFFIELGFSLDDIRAIIEYPEFDQLQALEAHKKVLQERVKRLKRLIHTVDKTILYLKGNLEMEQKEFYEGFSEEKQKQYEQEARQRYGDEAVQESVNRWNSYSPQQKTAIQAEGEAIYASLRAGMDQGYDSPEVQAHIQALHKHIGYFYECSYERLLGLGQLYTEHPDFVAMFQSRYHADFPEFLYQAIAHYVQNNRATA